MYSGKRTRASEFELPLLKEAVASGKVNLNEIFLEATAPEGTLLPWETSEDYYYRVIREGNNNLIDLFIDDAIEYCVEECRSFTDMAESSILSIVSHDDKWIEKYGTHYLPEGMVEYLKNYKSCVTVIGTTNGGFLVSPPGYAFLHRAYTRKDDEYGPYFVRNDDFIESFSKAVIQGVIAKIAKEEAI